MALFFRTQRGTFSEWPGCLQIKLGRRSKSWLLFGEIWITYFQLRPFLRSFSRLVGSIAPPLSLPQALSRLNVLSAPSGVIVKVVSIDHFDATEQPRGLASQCRRFFETFPARAS